MWTESKTVWEKNLSSLNISGFVWMKLNLVLYIEFAIPPEGFALLRRRALIYLRPIWTLNEAIYFYENERTFFIYTNRFLIFSFKLSIEVIKYVRFQNYLLYGKANPSVLIGSFFLTDRFRGNGHKLWIFFCFRKPTNSKQAWVNYLLT